MDHVNVKEIIMSEELGHSGRVLQSASLQNQIDTLGKENEALRKRVARTEDLTRWVFWWLNIVVFLLLGCVALSIIAILKITIL